MALRIAIVVFLSSWSLFVQPAKGSQLLHRLLYNLATSYSYGSITGTTFSSLVEIRGNGSLLVNVSPDDGNTGQFVLFPNMTFNCSGRITKVKFLALRTHRNLDFGVGQLQGDVNSYQVKHYIIEQNVREGNTILFEQQFLSRVFQFEPGNVFALKQSDPLLMYNIDSTIEVLICSKVHGHGKHQMYTCVTGHGYQPLVTIETGI